MDNLSVLAGKNNPAKTKAQSLDNAISDLVKGLKRDLVKKYGRVNYTRLRKNGFSEVLLKRLQRA